MSWVKIDDQFHSNPKVVAAGAEAVALYVVALSWSGAYLTDGFIPTGQVRRLALSDKYEDATRRLVEVGLWHEVEGGYEIHDYLEYNPTAEEVKATREERAEAGRRGGLASAESKRQARAEARARANASANEKQNSTPSPSPSPSPLQPTNGADAPAPPATFDGWLTGYQSADNRSGYAGWMLSKLYPSYYKGNVKPNYGMLGKMLNDNDANYVLSLFFQHSARPPVGDPVKFVAGILSKDKKGNGRQGPPPPKQRTIRAEDL